MLVNIYMKFHEGTLTVFFSYRADTTISQNLLFSVSKGHNPKNTQSRVTVLALCTSSHVFELQSGHDFVTDRRTDDQGKNNMSPNPTGGDIIKAKQ